MLRHSMFRKVLIANRGEIAVRIARTLQEMGITACVVHSDADAGALHVRCADEAYALPGVSAAETYLRGERIVEVARAHSIDAIHPGYGFLSENAEFAQACTDARIAFIGPTPAVIRAMGDKVVARQTAATAGVPVVPGWCGSAEEMTGGRVQVEAERIGYPVLLKAAAGGGGKGMRIVRRSAEVAEAMAAAAREAQGAFGDARMFVEKYIENPRHVEIQVFGDGRGNVLHLGERECSIQRRHQKIIEETPSPALSPELRARMADAAVRLARTLGYANAGTVEFILAPDGAFYFLEVNTRLQVEHPVTELVLRRDLVAAQVRVAAGEGLPFAQEDCVPQGHALECRVYAEDAQRGFVPQTGTIEHYIEPGGPYVRVDSGVMAGTHVPVHYDPLLAKVSTWGCDRGEALARMRAALRRFVILGVTTNLDFLQDVLAHEEFAAGRIDTHFLERHAMHNGEAVPQTAWIAAALCANARAAASTDGTGETATPWRDARGWRIAGGEVSA